MLSDVYKIPMKAQSKRQKETYDEKQPRMLATTDYITS